MADVSKIKVNGTDYNLKDSESRKMASVFPLMQSMLMEGIPHTTSITESKEWQMLLTDSEDKILAGIRQDGTPYCGYDTPTELFNQLLSLYQTTSESNS